MRRPSTIHRVHCSLFPVRPAILPLTEPDLLRRTVHVLEIVDAGMSEERLESVRVSGDPVGHVSTVRSSAGAYAGRIEPRVARQRSVETVHQVGVNFSTPVA